MTGNKNWRHHPGAGNWGEWTDQPWGGRGPRHGGRGPQGGPPPWAAALFGFPQPDQRRGPRVRRGDVRTAILSVLAEAQGGEPVNGYQVIQQIAAKSNGAWRPSPGSVYPTIQQLEDEGLVFTDEATGRRALLLTAEGQAYVAEHDGELAAVWRPFQPREERATNPSADFKSTLKSEIGQVATAVWQLATQGSEVQRQAALDVLVETRRKLYGILADGPAGPESASDDSDES